MLDDKAIEAALRDLPGWTRRDGEIVRTFRRRDWASAIALLNAVAPEADRRNHHPDVEITGYRDITFRLTTHSKGGITQRDVDLARWIDGAADDAATDGAADDDAAGGG
jgi:4a-hydroxytetrahydrobiopterin dehydratase